MKIIKKVKTVLKIVLYVDKRDISQKIAPKKINQPKAMTKNQFAKVKMKKFVKRLRKNPRRN